MDWADLDEALALASYAQGRAASESTLAAWSVAIRAWSEALALVPDDMDPLPLATELAYCYEDRFLVGGDPGDLQRAIGLYLSVLRLGEDLDYRDSLSATLGTACLRGFTATGEVGYLDLAMDALEQSIAGGHLDTRAEESARQNWALACSQRAQARADPDELDAAIEAFRALEDATDVSTRATALSNLGTALRARYGFRPDSRDLNEAVSAQLQALDLLDAASTQRPIWMMNLANALVTRFRVTGGLDDLRAAVDRHREGVELARSSGGGDLPLQLHNLGEALNVRFEVLGFEEDRTEALAAFEQALEASPQGSQAGLAATMSLGSLLNRRYQNFGDAGDLERASALAATALDQARPGSADQVRAFVLSGQLARVKAARLAEDPGVAVTLLTRARDLAPRGVEIWLTAQGALGEALLTRHKLRGDFADLDAAIDALTDAVRLAPVSSGTSADLSASLAECLSLRYQATSDPSVLENALAYYRNALQWVSPGSDKFARWTVGLAVTAALGVGTGAPSEADETVRILRGALDSLNPRSGSWAMIQTELAGALVDRYRRAGDLKDLDDAIAAAVAGRVSRGQRYGGVEDAWGAHMLGEARRCRYSRTGDDADLVAAADAYREALDLLPGDLSSRLRVAASGGLAETYGEAGDWDRASEAFRVWLDCFDQHSTGQLLAAGRDATLRAAGPLHHRAAFALARAGHLAEAVMAIESGAARALSAALELDQIEVTRLAEAHPDAAAALHSAAARAREADEAQRRFNPAADAAETQRQFARVAQEEFWGAVEAARTLPGFEHFLRRQSYEDIVSALATVPGHVVAYLLSTRYGGLVLLLLPSSREIRPMWLDALRADDLAALLVGRDEDPAYPGAGWATAYAEWHDPARPAEAANRFTAAIDEVAAYLGTEVVAPLVAVATAAGADRLTLVPTGIARWLPLHAAWTGNHQAPTGRSYCTDRLAVSYAPSASVLARCLARRTAADSVLVVTEPAPVSADPLPGSAAEAAAARAAFAVQQTLAGTDATPESVLEWIATADVIHLCCHGSYRSEAPLDSGLLMSGDQLLTVRDILGRRMGRARLAVLSACQTGMAGLDLPDEVVGLPAAFIQAGFDAVIASNWAVNDLATALLMHRFYLGTNDSDDPAKRLRDAQAWLRNSTNAVKARWYEQEERSPHAGRREAAALARQLIEPALARHADECSFAHPYWWAGFSVTGA